MSQQTLQEIQSRSISNLTFDQLMIKLDSLMKEKLILEDKIEKEKYQLRELLFVSARKNDEDTAEESDIQQFDLTTNQLQHMQTEIDKLETELMVIEDDVVECRALIQEELESCE